MTTATFNVNVTNYDADDRRAARKRVTQENQLIANQNQQLIQVNNVRAQNIPPLPPIADTPLLLMSTQAELDASYEACLAKDDAARHAALVASTAEEVVQQSATFKQLKTAFVEASDAKRAAALAALA